MGNMSYCRFENTSLDLLDCQRALVELLELSTGPLSESELQAATRLVTYCLGVVRAVAEEAGLEVQDLDEMDPDKLRRVVGEALEDANADAADGDAID